MIEPQSAQLGASAWVWKLTFVAPRLRVTVPVPPPFPFPAFPLPLLVVPWPLACPLVARTVSSSLGAASAVSACGGAEGAVATGRSPPPEVASEVVGSTVVSGVGGSPAELPLASAAADAEAEAG